MKTLSTTELGAKVVAPLIGKEDQLQEAVGMRLVGIAYAKNTPKRLVLVDANKGTPDDIDAWLNAEDDDVTRVSMKG